MSKLIRIILFCLGHFLMVNAFEDAPILQEKWTWLYQKACNKKEKVILRKKKIFVFKEENTFLFTQLLCSFNIIRPEKGYFSLSVQVRDAHTKAWGNWHLMTHWGKDIQKTYVSTSDSLSKFVHVRLELESQKLADAFCIKIESHNDAQLDLIDHVFAAISRFDLFKEEDSGHIKQNVPSIYIEGVPAIAQFTIDHTEKHRICSPVSCAMMVGYLIGTIPPMIDFLKNIFDEGLSIYGSWPCNIAQMFNACNNKINFIVRRANSFCDIGDYLSKKLPVIVSVRGELPGALKPFPHGHLMVIVGWDQEKAEVICHDPAAQSNDMVVKRYPLEQFLRAWERSHRLMYVAHKKLL